ncbi:MAG: sortase family protein [Patescibacteria group bacterium]|jgi:LPXTG-site transpeptidase (sortase) family protein|nr:sortase family protein [Patescibacteria group bacterium]
MSGFSIKAVAGMCALLAVGVLSFLYGPIALSAIRLPLPTVALHWGNVQVKGVNFEAFDGSPTLLIPKLGIEAPIIRNVSLTNQSEYDSALHTGIGLGKGTADLESPQGNSFLFGHSSNVSLRPTIYDSIFANLPNMVEGDRFLISVGGRQTEYVVERSHSIEATEVSYLASSDTRHVTLVTCWPIGTNLKRWVVQARPAL